MLWFVGIGISGAALMPDGAKEILGKADHTYLEEFTSPVPDSDARAIKDMAGGSFSIAKRWMVEDGAEILRKAKTGSVALVSYGDPYMATTHAELRRRAISEGTKTGSIHAASVITAITGECGLHQYKMGRCATIMRDVQSIMTPYDTVLGNLEAGAHTILLLEYDKEGGFFLDPGEALNMMASAEDQRREGVIESSAFAIVASRIGLEGQAIKAGAVSALGRLEYGRPPHSIIIPGPMHFTEYEALSSFAECLEEPGPNPRQTNAQRMVAKYIPMVNDAIKKIEPHCRGDSGAEAVIDGARRYSKDAADFVAKGRGYVAVLSIGYADGLVDALRIAKGLER